MAWFGQYAGTTTGQWWGDSTSSVPVSVPAVGGVGRRQEYHYVVIDGVDHRVSSPEEAAAILLQLRALAAKRAKRQARKAVRRSPTDPVVVPLRATVRIDDYSTEFAQRVQAQVDAANAKVAEYYAQAVRAALVWHQAKEDDEIGTLIALGIL